MAGPNTLEFTDKNFDEDVLASDKPVLVDFWAEWCAPCKALGPVIDELAGVLGKGDVIIDGGNSRWIHDGPRAERLANQGIEYLDCGVSGGVWGITQGYALMVGGDESTVAKVQPIFDSLKPAGEFGFVHAGEPAAQRQEESQGHRKRNRTICSPATSSQSNRSVQYPPIPSSTCTSSAAPMQGGSNPCPTPIRAVLRDEADRVQLKSEPRGSSSISRSGWSSPATTARRAWDTGL